VKSFGKWLHYVLMPAIALVSSRTRPRVRVELRTRSGHVLLVKTWFSRQLWGLPGGGVDRGEAPSRAAVREVREETGVVIDKSRLHYLTTLPAEFPLRCDLVIYRVKIGKRNLLPLPWTHRYEIIEREWFNVDELPDDISPLTRAIIRREFADQ